ncbi:MAG: nitrile hydratase subunit beta [Pseudomonadota bacterium]
MNGGADLGGMQGFGPVVEETDEPNFHAAWEARVLGMVVALGAAGQWNLDQSRFARESLPPADYLTFPYYRIWLEAAEKLLLERGMISAEELESGRMQRPAVPIKGRLAPADVEAALRKGGPVDREPEVEPRFVAGEAVHVININPAQHTRLPRYARGKRGEIAHVLGFHVFPDSNARGEGENPQWLYQVRFTARELWGENANAADTVTLDLWESYLRPTS